MASIKLTISRGGYSTDDARVDADVIEIAVPIPDRAAFEFTASEYLELIGTTFDKTGELVDVVRGTADDLLDVDLELSDEDAAAWRAAGEAFGKPRARAVIATLRATGRDQRAVQDTQTGRLYAFDTSPIVEVAAEINRGELSFDRFEPMAFPDSYDIEEVSA